MITGIVLTKNEENNIVDAIESLSFCDQIVVVDDNSIDRTKELLKVLKNEHRRFEIYERPLSNDFSGQRNFALSKAKNEWVFFLDADERVSKGLKEEILRSVRTRGIDGYYIKREDQIWGKKLKHGETSGIWLLRFARKSKGMWKGKVHEVWKITGKTRKLSSVIEHLPHPTLSEFLSDINLYTNIRAKELHEKGERVNAVTLILYPKGKFILNYILRRGFLDGSQGFIVAMLMSFHSFLVRAKLWMLWQK